MGNAQFDKETIQTHDDRVANRAILRQAQGRLGTARPAPSLGKEPWLRMTILGDAINQEQSPERG